MRKWRETHSLYFPFFSLFPPSLSISYIKICLILLQNVKYGTFVANVAKNLTCTRYEKIILGRIRAETCQIYPTNLNQTYKTKANNPNLPNQTKQTKFIKPNIQNQSYQTSKTNMDLFLQISSCVIQLKLQT